MKSSIFGLVLTLIFSGSVAQVSVPVFANKSDSAEYAAIEQELRSQFQKRSRDKNDASMMDSLMRRRAHLRELIIGYKTIYKADPKFTAVESLTSATAEEVTQLSIANYSGKRIPKEVFECSALQELELVNVKIKTLPKKLGRLKNLKKIYIYNNEPGGKMRLGKNLVVKDLLIRGTDQTKLPRNYRQFRAIENLDLSQNIGMNQFPNISKNANIKKLNLISNVITLSDLDRFSNGSLEELNIQKNKVERVPASISNFPKLKKLTLNYNQVKSVDDALGTLQQLEEVSFYQNKLESVPSGLYKIADIKVIDLYFNEIKKIEPAIVNLNNLEILYLSNNQIAQLPDNLGDMTNLKELYVHNNKLSYLPESMEKLLNLKVLRLNNNYFTSFPTCILKLVTLENLDVSKNNLHQFPTELADFRKLQILALVDNPWENKDDVTEAAVRLHAQGTIVHMNDQIVLEGDDQKP